MAASPQRILILGSNKERHAYFTHNVASYFLHECHVVAFITEAKSNPSPPLFEKITRDLKKGRLLKRIKNFVSNQIFKKYIRRFEQEKSQAEKEFFGGAKEKLKEIEKDLDFYEELPASQSINSITSVQKIREWEPDIIAVMGTSLIKSPIIEIPKIGILNLHTGLSPYYRGCYTNLFPILNKEPQFCGVTIHDLDPGIDSGSIIFTSTVEDIEGETYSSINCKSIVKGTELMIKAIQAKLNGKDKTVPQWEKGKLYLLSDLNGFIFYKYDRIKRSGGIKPPQNFSSPRTIDASENQST